MPKVETVRPRRGEIWRVHLEPTQGSEIRSAKGGPHDTRPVLVLTRPDWGTPGVALCAPLTDYNPQRDSRRFWRVPIMDALESGLSKICCVDVGQTRALDISRFVRQDGRAHPLEVEATVASLVKGLGYSAPHPQKSESAPSSTAPK